MPVPLTPHELKVRVQIKGKVKAKPSNPQHFLPPCPLGRPSRVVKSACTPFVSYRPSSQHIVGRPFRAVLHFATLQAVHLGPSGVPSQPTTLTHLNLSLHLATLQAVHLGPSGVFAIDGHPNTWPFSRPRLAAVVREYGHRWWISWTSFASLLQCNSRRERPPLTTTPRFPSSVPSSRLANRSRDTNLAFTLFSSSTSESDGQDCCGEDTSFLVDSQHARVPAT